MVSVRCGVGGALTEQQTGGLLFHKANVIMDYTLKGGTGVVQVVQLSKLH